MASALDGQDPEPMLAEIGVLVPAEPTSAEIHFLRLIFEADRLFATLPGPAVAEVRAGLNQWRGGRVTLAPRRNPVAAAHLADAMVPQFDTHLAQAIAFAAPYLTWKPCDSYPIADIGAAFANGQVYAALIGEAATMLARDDDLGLFLIAPHLLYHDHHHAAPELYAPLTGPHGWHFGPKTPLIVKSAHAPVWNDPHRPHPTRVGPTPFLALCGCDAALRGDTSPGLARTRDAAAKRSAPANNPHHDRGAAMRDITATDRKIANIHTASFVPFVCPDGAAHGAAVLQLDTGIELGTGFHVYRIPAGMTTRGHRNFGQVKFLILEGELHESDGHILKAGDLVFYRAGSEHNSFTPNVCLRAVHGAGPEFAVD